MLNPIHLREDSAASSPFETQARLFGLLGDKTRLHILHLLLQQPDQLCVDELVEQLGYVAQPTVSYHLKLLYYEGVLSRSEEKQRTYYRVKPHIFDKIRHILDQIGQ